MSVCVVREGGAVVSLTDEHFDAKFYKHFFFIQDGLFCVYVLIWRSVLNVK